VKGGKLEVLLCGVPNVNALPIVWLLKEVLAGLVGSRNENAEKLGAVGAEDVIDGVF